MHKIHYNKQLNLFLAIAFGMILSGLIFSGPAFSFEEKQKNCLSVTPVDYGIYCENLNIQKRIIKNRQNLSQIFKAEGFSPSRIHEIVTKCKDVMDVRKIRAGKPYYVMNFRYSGTVPRYLVYETTPLDYIIFDLGNPVSVYKGIKHFKIKTRTVEGTIDSSLWNAFSKNNLNFNLATKLSEIFAWSIDFFHFQKGDKFTMVIEEKWVNNKKAGTGKIIAAKMTIRGKEHYAFRFKSNDGRVSYYDENGKSLQKRFLKAPLKYVCITSGFTRRRFHPIYHKYKAHLGIDYSAPRGTPIMTVGDGIIETVGYDRTRGKYIRVRHNHKYMSQYIHMCRYARGMKKGVRVSQGDVIGYVGTTGLATGPHLDFRFWIDGRPVNYLTTNISVNSSVDKKHISSFRSFVAGMKAKLDTTNMKKFIAKK